jgi:serine/threonine-protein kinase
MIGKTISHYRVTGKLGEGGMGVVYKAEDTELKRTVALKFLPGHVLEDEEERARFVHEARAAASLDHPNICIVYEIGRAEGHEFIAMAYVEGATLKERIEAGPMKPSEAVNVAVQVADALREAHDHGIVHRDIKPANIMITAKGRAKILDFGISRSAALTKITKTGTTLGTVAYMSPEQARGEGADSRSDIWSLGVVLYEMLTGRLPFEGDYDQAIVYGILNRDPEPISGSCPDAPPELEGILRKTLAKEPDERYQQAVDLLEDLKPLSGVLEVRAGRSELEKTDAGAPESDSERTEVEVGDTRVIPSIAVLPFVNMSPDPENEYFGDGLAEELINALAQIEGLRVAARTSAFRFRGGEADIREIGDRLGVSTLLEGSVRRAGNKVRVTAQLISVADGYHLWSSRYDRELEDIFVIQEEISLAIVKQLKVKLAVGEIDKPIVKKYTENLDAYSLFLKGRYYWYKLTAEGWSKSMEYFEKAIGIDPTFAPAYAWLSISRQSQAFWGDRSPREVIARSRELAETAIRMDDSIAEAHSSLAVTHFVYDWDADAADREFQRSLELAPADALARVNYALILMTRNRKDEAMAQARHARKLDPLSGTIAAWTGVMPCYVGRYDEAIEQLEQAVPLAPDYWQLHYSLGEAYLHASKSDEAIEASRKAVDLSGGASVALVNLACALYLSGRSGEGEEVLDGLKERARQRYVSSAKLALVHAAKGDREDAVAFLEKAYEERDPWICWQKLAPAALRFDDPRIEAIMKRVGI